MKRNRFYDNVWIECIRKGDLDVEMKTVPLTVPEGLAPYLENADQESSFERNAMMLYPYINRMIISHGRAAEILGVRKRDLIEFYNSIGLPYLNQTKDDLLSDLAMYDRVKEKTK